MEIPEGMDEYGGDKVMLLHKSIYGLKQASRLSNEHLDAVLGVMEFHRLSSNFGLYTKGKWEDRILMGVYVDDIMMLAQLMKVINHLKGQLKDRFRMKDLGAASFILGLEIRRQPNGDILLVQEKYAGDILRKFNMHDCSTVNTPLEAGIKLSRVDSPKTSKEELNVEKYPYRSAMGSLVYFAQGTRPDFAASVSNLSSFNQNPGLAHWEAMLHVLRYLKGTMGQGIMYRRGVSTDYIGKGGGSSRFQGHG